MLRRILTSAAALAAAALGAMRGSPIQVSQAFDTARPNARPIKLQRQQRRTSNPVGYFKRQGAQECARRRRQIERGQLTVSNGLTGYQHIGWRKAA